MSLFLCKLTQLQLSIYMGKYVLKYSKGGVHLGFLFPHHFLVAIAYLSLKVDLTDCCNFQIAKYFCQAP